MILESLQKARRNTSVLMLKLTSSWLRLSKYKDGTEVCKNIQFTFIDSCRFMASSLDKLASNLCGTSGIQCDKYKGNMELINFSGDCIASLGCERCRTKKTKDLEEGALQKTFNHTSRF